MKPKDLVEHLLSEAPDFDSLVARIVARAEKHMGDVIDDETSDENAREETWTLCIDAANEILHNDRPLAIKVASEAAHQLGYTPKGYRPRKTKPAGDPVWPPRVGNSPEEPERVVKPTGVVHGQYRPSFLYPQG
jgi:hypothetical protein